MNDRCRSLYEEIQDLKEHLKLKNDVDLISMLFDEEINFLNVEDGDDESVAEDLIRERIKKTFQRKSWEKGEAKSQTKILLEEIRDSIYKSSKYKKAKENMILPWKNHNEMKKVSKDINRSLKKKSSG